MESLLTESEKQHLKFKPFIDDEFAKNVLANKRIDDKIASSDEPRYVELRKVIAEGNIQQELDCRMFAWIKEMENIGGNWKVNWEDEIATYYKSLPYHDEINVMLGNKHVVIPKKTYMPSESVDKNIIQHIQYELDAKMGGSKKS